MSSMRLLIGVLFVPLLMIRDLIALETWDGNRLKNEKSTFGKPQVEEHMKKVSSHSVGINDRGKWYTAFILIGGLVHPGTVGREYFQQVVDFVVQVYDKSPCVMSLLGPFIGIISMLDSLNDLQWAQRHPQRIYDAFEAYLREDISQKCLKKRLMEIREDAESLLIQQRNFAGLKLIPTVIFGYLSYARTRGILAKSAEAIASGLCGVSSIVDAVNYNNLDRLAQRLKQDNYTK